MNSQLKKWLAKQNPWLQDAAEKILRNGSVSDIDIEHFVSIIKSSGETITSEDTEDSEIVPAAAKSIVRLISLGPVRGVDAMQPRRPLELSNHNLSVIYGHNGSGKSGYTRIIKRASGKPNACELKSNVFTDDEELPECEFRFEIDGTEKTVAWKSADPAIAELDCIDVFDTQRGRLYVDGETELSFKPPELAFLGDLIDVCSKVEAVLNKQRDALVCKLPELQASFDGSDAAVVYYGIKADTDVDKVCAELTWSAEDQSEYKSLVEQLHDVDVTKTLAAARRQLQQIEGIETELKSGAKATSAAMIEQFDQQISSRAAKRQAADEFAKSLECNSAITGIGEASWRAMWTAAQAFATEVGGDSVPFPRTDEKSRCVLCHQTLDEDARSRFQRFDEFVRGKLEAEAQAEELRLKTMIEGLPIEPSDASLSTSVQASGEDDVLEEELKAAWKMMRSVLKDLRRSVIPTNPGDCQQITETLVSKIGVIKQKREQSIAKLDADAKAFDRAIALERVRQFEARRWVVQQMKAMQAEVDRQKRQRDFDEWKKQTATTGISRQASKLSQTLITDALVERFNGELKNLGAHKIKVGITKRTPKGNVLHKIVFTDVKKKISSPSDVLSEGEQRIIALAAFLADSTGRPAASPVVFDDPISSLDHAFEEKMIDRLIDLSKSRQVIVFTHRLSLFGLISEKSGGAFNDVHIQREPWGTGEPGEMQLFPKNPLGALNDLKDRRLTKAKSVLSDDGYVAYMPLAKAICSDFRILMECICETHLLAGVVQRYRRSVQTLNRLSKLAMITPDDCQVVEYMMTKYSCYEHSQSDELPGDSPEPDDLANDMNQVIEWLTNFKKRMK
ncbi:AAA family ATPase [Stieleria sp. JC731]|uniref:AAA family ATPase n=1 Tax=Pirellulaceae TaxID=2691357 RepID=UPI001E3E146B|nr:AAA family ATPase [Stieleria sp. JC731]MCC9600706.1 AAA family ATPase [Stieleria sp. JC731]